MRFQQSLLTLLGLVTFIHALALPASFAELSDSTKQLFKRKGGGRGGGGGSFRGSSSSSGSRGSSGSTRSPNTITPTYGGGRYYGGGGATAYRSGSRSPGGYAPYLLGGAALGFFPGIWLYGAYAYGPYNNHYNYHNDTTNENQSLPVQCFCAQYAECGCGENNDTDYIDSIIDNKTLARVANVNGTDTLVVNGTLPNGTEEAMASAAMRLGQGLAELSGFWPMLAVVGYLTFFM